MRAERRIGLFLSDVDTRPAADNVLDGVVLVEHAAPTDNRDAAPVSGVADHFVPSDDAPDNLAAARAHDSDAIVPDAQGAVPFHENAVCPIRHVDSVGVRIRDDVVRDGAGTGARVDLDTSSLPALDHHVVYR